jgi:hypothetical protein
VGVDVCVWGAVLCYLGGGAGAVLHAYGECSSKGLEQ